MRAFLNGILAFIGASSLTDIEFESLTIDSAAHDEQTYDALNEVLTAREAISTLHDKLNYYFKAKGVEVGEVSVGGSNIFIGSVL